MWSLRQHVEACGKGHVQFDDSNVNIIAQGVIFLLHRHQPLSPDRTFIWMILQNCGLHLCFQIKHQSLKNESPFIAITVILR